MISAPFKARFDGKCKSPACVRDGRILKNRQIVLLDREEGLPGIVWHDGCPQPDIKAIRAAQAASGVAAAPAVTIDRAPISRGQGPLFDAAAESEAVVTPPVAVRRDPAAAASPAGGNADFLSGLAAALVPFLDERLRGYLDHDAVNSMIETALEGAILKTVTTVEVMDYAHDEARDLGIQHSQFPLLLQTCSARKKDGYRLNVWLAGPAGSGKTTAAAKVAEALGLEFWACGAQDNPYGLLGFRDAQGNYAETEFLRLWRDGGLILLDELDAWLPSAFMPFNAMLANGIGTFPCGMVPRSKDCLIIGAANTYGLGATNDYVGRFKLDKASLNRFVPIPWPIDEGLELAMTDNPAWVERVQQIRKAFISKGIQGHLITPRQSQDGAALLATGMDQTLVETLVLRQSLSSDQWAAVSGVIQ